MTAQPAFTCFRYQHTDGVTRSRQRLMFVGSTLALALVVATMFAAPVGAALLAVPLFAWLAVPRQLLLGPRYLLCGNTIVYFGNVKRVTLSSVHGKLRLECTNGTAFVLERRRFPRSVRPIEKLVNCQATQFDRLTTQIIAQVRAKAANAILIQA
jgi:hypothetical protein